MVALAVRWTKGSDAAEGVIERLSDSDRTVIVLYGQINTHRDSPMRCSKRLFGPTFGHSWDWRCDAEPIQLTRSPLASLLWYNTKIDEGRRSNNISTITMHRVFEFPGLELFLET